MKTAGLTRPRLGWRQRTSASNPTNPAPANPAPSGAGWTGTVPPAATIGW